MALTDSLISFWEMEEASGTRNDSHGTNHLTDNNAVDVNAGIVGNAARFTAGAGQYLGRASNASLQTGYIDFTFALWAYAISFPGGNEAIFGKDNGTSEYFLDHESSGNYRWLLGSGGGSGAAITTAPSTGSFHFIVVDLDTTANLCSIQINNGTAVTAASSSFSAGASDFNIGRRPSGSGDPWHGRVDQVGFWKRVLTAGERTELYNGGAGLSYAAMSGLGPVGAGALSLAGIVPPLRYQINMPDEL